MVNGQDLMCKSRTGSGKTLAFAIPIIEALDRQSGGESVQKQRGGRGRLFSRGAYGRLPRAICVAPTRELAKQVCMCMCVFVFFVSPPAERRAWPEHRAGVVMVRRHTRRIAQVHQR